MKESTKRFLDECLEKAWKDIQENMKNPQAEHIVKRKIKLIKHRAAMYLAKIEEGQSRAYALSTHIKF